MTPFIDCDWVGLGPRVCMRMTGQELQVLGNVVVESSKRTRKVGLAGEERSIP